MGEDFTGFREFRDDRRFRNHTDHMAIRVRFLLAGAAVALSLAGCSAATPEVKAEEPSATSSTAVAPEAGATDVSAEQRQQAQQLAEEAEKIMLDPALPPKEKYPTALGMFRDALKIDPDNALAQQSITLIEDVYRSMGRPVPQAT